MKKKVAVIGGGILGTTIAIKASSVASVDLYEKLSDILSATSSINQYRLHNGYHYPRSVKTALSSLKSNSEFRKFYSSAIISNRDHYYAIAKKGSLTSAKDFMNFCKNLNLEMQETNLDIINNDEISLLIKAKEYFYDPVILRRITWEKLNNAKVNVYLNRKFEKKLMPKYDHVIISTYAYINELLDEFPNSKKNYQYEICEKPVVKLPQEFKNKSIVIMDGPFMCIDPYRRSSNIFLMGNVTHAIHDSNVGLFPNVPTKFKHVVNNGIIKNPSITNFNKFIETGSIFIPKLKNAKHVGSMYTIRSVLPNKEATDERPTIVEKINNKIVTAFSGKISTAITTAEEVSKIISQ